MFRSAGGAALAATATAAAEAAAAAGRAVAAGTARAIVEHGGGAAIGVAALATLPAGAAGPATRAEAAFAAISGAAPRRASAAVGAIGTAAAGLVGTTDAAAAAVAAATAAAAVAAEATGAAGSPGSAGAAAAAVVVVGADVAIGAAPTGATLAAASAALVSEPGGAGLAGAAGRAIVAERGADHAGVAGRARRGRAAGRKDQAGPAACAAAMRAARATGPAFRRVRLEGDVVERDGSSQGDEQAAAQPGAAATIGTAPAALGDGILDRQVADRNLAAERREPAIDAAAVQRVAVAYDVHVHVGRGIDGDDAGGLARLPFGDVAGDVGWLLVALPASRTFVLWPGSYSESPEGTHSE